MPNHLSVFPQTMPTRFAKRRRNSLLPMMKTIEIRAEPKEKAAALVSLVRQMYDLLGSNMTAVVPGSTPGWQSDAEFSKWRDGVFLGDIQRNTSHLLLMDEKGLRGLLSYTAQPETTEIYLNEVQIRPSCRGDGATLRCLMRGFADRIGQIPHDTLRTYTNKANTRVHGLFEKCGFERVGETDRGYQYLMLKRTFLARFRREGRQP